MTFPSRGGPREQLSEVLREAMTIAQNVKRSSITLKNQTAAGTITVRGILLFTDDLTAYSNRLDILRIVPGIGEYAKAQYSDAGLDLNVEFLAMQSSMSTVVTWIDANIPKSGGRWVEAEEIVSGRLVERKLTSIQTLPLRVELDVLITLID